MKYALIDAEFIYKVVNDKTRPVVVLIGRDENGHKRMYEAEYYPYIYISEEDYQDHKDDEVFRNCKVTGAWATTIKHQSVSKIILKDPRLTMGMSKQLFKFNKVTEGDPIWSYEADLSEPCNMPIRFLIDKGIKTGFEVTEGGELIPADVDIPLRKWYIDFEALGTKLACSGPKKEDPIPVVTFYDSYQDRYYTLYIKNPKLTIDMVSEQYPEGTHFNVVEYPTEGLLLDGLRYYVEQLDPDLITAWNLDRYDIIKWMQRMDACHINSKTLSPFRNITFRRLSARIKGRITFDLLKGFKRFTDAELRSYALGAVCEEEKLPHEKIPLKKPTQWIWDNEPLTLIKRNINDVLILTALDRKYELIDMFDEIRKEFGTMYNEVLLNHRVIDTALMRMVHNRFVLNTCVNQEKPKERFLGAVVIEPVPDMYSYIAELDLSRDYPSILKMFNISPETFIVDVIDRDPDTYYTIKYRDVELHFVKKPIGLLPQLIDNFFKKRDEYDKLLEQAVIDKDERKIKIYSRRSYALKKMTNAIYGVMDFPGFRLFKQQCSEAIAILGRITIEEIQRYLRECGLNVVYGDTDSIFVQLESKEKEKALEEGKQIQDKINMHLLTFFPTTFGTKSAPTGLGLKKLYTKFLSVSKKMYAGKSFWDEKKGYKEDFDFKGLAMIRSDTSFVEKTCLEETIKLLLEEKIDEAWVTSNGYLERVRERQYSPLEVSYPQQLVKPFSQYVGDMNVKDNLGNDVSRKKTIPAHVRAALFSNHYLDTSFNQGDKPKRLPIKLPEIASTQTTLDNPGVVSPYPNKWIWKLGDWQREFKIQDISISEDMEIPQYFIDHIDWLDIFKRLEGKVLQVKKLIK